MLPDGWAEVPVSQIAELLRGVSYEKTAARETAADGYLPILRATNIQGEHLLLDADLVYVPEKYVKPEQRLRLGDVVVCMSSGSNGSGWQNCSTPQEVERFIWCFLCCRAFCPAINQRFAGYFFSSPGYRSLIRERSSGISINNLRRGDIETLLFPVPPPTEQRRIVAEIETQFTRLEAGVAALKRAQAKLRRYKAAVLQAACEGRLVPTEAEMARAEGRDYEPAGVLLQHILAERRARWQAEHPGRRYQEPTPPDTPDLPELPEGWVWATVECVAEHRLGKMLDQVKNKGTLRPYLRNLNVRWFGFDLSDVQLMRVTDDELGNVSIKFGDLVVCEGGEPGRAAVWERTDETMVIQKALHRVRPFRGVVSHYLAYRLATDALSGSLEAYFTGSTIKHFTGQALRAYAFPLPPGSEQHRIVAEVERRLSVVGELEKQVEAALRRAERLRQAILSKAYRGKLIEQNPNDEPVDILLERVRRSKDLLAQQQREHPVQKERRKVDRQERTKRESLHDILIKAGGRLTPEDLFRKAGFTKDTVDEFFEELRTAIKYEQVKQFRPNDAEVYLEEPRS